MRAGIIGHEYICNLLERMVAHGQFSHAYLFVGPPRVGKQAVAKWFAARLLGIEGKHLSVHPDYFFVGRMVNEKTGKMQQEIPIETIRTLRASLGESALRGGRKVAVIADAHTFSVGAANALLKTLEEPLGDTNIILTAPHERLLPKTIISRCVVVRFGLVPAQEIHAYLLGNGTSETNADEWTATAAGRPGVAFALMNDEAYRTAHEAGTKECAAFLEGAPYERLGAVQKRASKEDTVVARQEADEFLVRCVEYLHRRFVGATAPPAWYRRAADALLEARALLKGNVQTRLVLEYAALHC